MVCYLISILTKNLSDLVLVRRLHEYLHLFVFMIIHLAIIELSYTT